MPPDEPPAEPTRILVVDDHPIMRAGLAQLIGEEPDLTICCEAADAHGALEAVETLQPDLAIVDITLKDSSGIDLIMDLRVRRPKLPVLVLSMHDEMFYAERALRAGARGYVTKSEVADRIIEAVRKVLAGEVYVSGKVADKMISSMVGGRSDPKAFPIDRLTDRELQVLELIGEGLQTREIAGRLHVSVKTVDAHREHIKRKLDLDGANELVKYAVQWVQFERGS